MRAQRIVERCRLLATFSETAGHLRRTFLSPPMRGVHRLLREWMEAAGMQVWIDAAGNLRGVYPAAQDPAPRLLLGSHLDTVPDAGAFDGVLGVVLAIELVDSLADRRLPFAIEVAAFSDEEGVRFGVPFLGSRALTGALDAALLARCDPAGVSLEEAIRAFGLDPQRLPEARLDERAFAYLEFHIEQGPELDSLHLPLAVVTSIAGQSRATVTFRGEARHAGTTPMPLRRDALAGAARWIAFVEHHARRTPGLVATVGALQVSPGAANVVSGEVRASLDVRHPDNSARRCALQTLRAAADRIAASRGLTAEWRLHADAPSTPCDAALTGSLARAVETAGFPVHRMPSGAGHDAMILAQCLPIAMLFLRSPGGISHHPAETVHAADVEAALSAGAAFLAELERAHA